MEVNIRRYKKSTYVSKKKKLPDDLSFLKGVTFYAIAEYKTGKNKNIFIEFQPKSIKNIITKAKAFKQINCDLQDIKSENGTLIWNLKRLMGALELLGHDYMLVARSQDDKIDSKDRSPKNYLNVFQEHGFFLQGLPLQGGLTGLGKK